jgi:acyl-ACP thioesterase
LHTDFDELVAHPGVGRSFERTVLPGLGDAAPGGRVRLDALARWLQDVAHADVRDAGLVDGAAWVVRRARMLVHRFPRFDEPATLHTFCSGLGRMWAQRRTTVTTPQGAHVEAVALWVHLDPASGRPMPLTQSELALYAPSAAGREIKARLRHPGPPATAERTAWRFRAAELDLAGHINNAAYWVALEEELLGGRCEPDRLDVELEFRTPAQPGEFSVLRDGPYRWIVAPGGGVHASVVIRRP